MTDRPYMNGMKGEITSAVMTTSAGKVQSVLLDSYYGSTSVDVRCIVPDISKMNMRELLNF